MLSARFTLMVFALFSLLATGCGSLTMATAGLPAGLWLRNLAAWLVGGGLAVVISRIGLPKRFGPLAALVLLALTFFMTGQSGVHRWLGLGPLQINAAALILPLAVASLRWDRFLLLLLPMGGLLILQPDASQATALAVAGVLYVLLSPASMPARLAAGLLALIAGALSWLRPDPLSPVAHVEGIAVMAWGQSPLLATVMISALIISSLSPLLLCKVPEKRAVAAALAGYFSITGLTAGLGAFPVPLAGYGISFVLGWWLAVGHLLNKKHA